MLPSTKYKIYFTFYGGQRKHSILLFISVYLRQKQNEKTILEREWSKLYILMDWFIIDGYAH